MQKQIDSLVAYSNKLSLSLSLREYIANQNNILTNKTLLFSNYQAIQSQITLQMKTPFLEIQKQTSRWKTSKEWHLQRSPLKWLESVDIFLISPQYVQYICPKEQAYNWLLLSTAGPWRQHFWGSSDLH